MSEIKYYHITRRGKCISMKSQTSALAAAKEGGYIWFDYYDPAREELEKLIKPLNLHPLSIEDCVDENQIPKIDDYPGYTFMLFNFFSYINKLFAIDEVDIFLGKNFLVTVSGHNARDRRVLRGIEQIIEREVENIKQGPAFLLHVILDLIVDRKFTAIEALEEELTQHEEQMLAGLSRFKPVKLLHIRREILTLRKSLFHEREIMVKICRKDSPFISEKTLFYYRDIYDHLVKLFELTETSREVVTNLLEIYLSMVNNHMARSANKMNKTVRRLTFITTIFMPLTLLSGIGGMSEWSMMTGPGNWKITYPLFLLGMLIIGAGTYFFLKWLDKKDQKSENRF